MSGIFNAISAFSGVLTGGAAPVTLGSITFPELEIPEQASYGGEQMMKVHKLPGGARVIDSMGRDDLDINWHGILEGPNATPRALQIDQIRIQGLPVQLSWDMLGWTVVVKRFVANYVHRNWIPYEISCVVLLDNSTSAQSNVFNLLPQSVQDDLNSALSTVMPLAGPVSDAIGVAQGALSVVGAFSKGSMAWVNALSDLSTAQSAVQDVVSVANGQLGGVVNGLSGVAGILGSMRAATAISNMSLFSSAVGNLAGGAAQQGFISRALVNLSNASG